jgi:thiosulfate reductase cytochrome b subunit
VTRLPKLTDLALLALLALLAVPRPAAAQQAANPIHPLFAPLDAAGHPVSRPDDVSADATCGACHDARYVAAHSEHARAGVQATCIQCHVDGGRLSFDASRLEGGKLRREEVRIGRPRTANCAACHGVVSDGAGVVAMPADLEAPAPPGGKTWSLTLGEGAVMAPQRMSESFLNLAGKAGLSAPWDAHTAKLVDCVGCHYARNDPRRTDSKRSRLEYLTSDPRRTSTAEFLVRPDHELAEPDCRSCHAPLAVHGFLPYRERHMQVLGCQACHAPGPRAPALEMIDATVATAAGTPAYVYRNVERRAGASEPLNAATVLPLRPLFVLRAEADGARRFAPVNVVSRWRWVTGPERTEVPFAQVVRAFQEGGGYAREILAALDSDHDGQLSEAELRLDTPAKVAVVAGRLKALGVADPVVDGVMEPHPLAHGVAGKETALRDCDACHGASSRLSGDYLLATYLPGGVPPRPPQGGRVELAGSVGPAPGGGLELRRDPDDPAAGLHILGRSREAVTNDIGLALFVLVFLGVTLHGLTRLVLARFRPRGAHAPEPLARVYAFGRYERIWHWTMAVSGVGLILTGLEIHRAGWRWPLGLPAAVTLHNALAVVLMVNALFSLFYHLATAAIRGFLPEPHGFLARVLEHLEYQTRGIFRGGPHPGQSAGQKLNPLQQLTYLALLNVLFPLQIATGVLIWAVGHWPAVGTALGGLTAIAPLHNLGAWLFLSFFFLHAYLVTTGRTVGEHLFAMTTGYQLVSQDPTKPEGA